VSDEAAIGVGLAAAVATGAVILLLGGHPAILFVSAGVFYFVYSALKPKS
jgi:hypothetical protein